MDEETNNDEDRTPDPNKVPSTSTMTTTKNNPTTTTSSAPLLDKILSRVKMVKMLGRARGGRASESHVAGRSGVATPGPSKGLRRSASASAEPGQAGQAPQLESAPWSTTAEAVSIGVGPDPEATDSDSHSILSTASSGYMLLDPSENSKHKFKVKDLGPFCEQLDHLLDYIKSTKSLNHLINSYPSKLQNSLDAQALELHTIYLEARAARLRIQQVKNQRKAIRKERRAIEKTLASIKDEEIKEMENYIALYDKTLMSRWEKIRGSNQEDVVESFIQDLKGKQKALEYLQTLSTNKLNQLHRNITPTATEESKPISLAMRRLSASSGARSSGRWRNKHHERAARGPSTNAAQAQMDVHPTMPSVPVANSSFSINLAPSFPGVSQNGGFTRISTLAPATFGSASSSLISNNIPSDPGNQSRPNMTSSPTHNMLDQRSTLQALFSDIQHPGTHDNLPINAVMPHLVATVSSTAGTMGGNERTENQNMNSSVTAPNDNGIELYTLHDPT